MRQGLIVLLVFSFGILGCQSMGNKMASREAPQRARTKISKKFPPVREFEKPSNILTTHNELNPAMVEEGTEIRGNVELTDKEKLFFELAGEKIDSISEITIYQKALEYYKQSDESALSAYSNLLLKKYPLSIYCDNVLYLQGMTAFNQKKFGVSLAAFQKILTSYPQSNKAVSALFAKGVVFKKMNLPTEAVRTLAQVINRYPGSPESMKAQDELKLMTE